jgi:hypothetical protein
VLACVDRSPYAEHVADYAAWAAVRLDAPLEFLHVIDRTPAAAAGDDRSGAIGLGAQEKLLDRLSAEDETQARVAREEGRIFLNRLREPSSTLRMSSRFSMAACSPCSGRLPAPLPCVKVTPS